MQKQYYFKIKFKKNIFLKLYIAIKFKLFLIFLLCIKFLALRFFQNVTIIIINFYKISYIKLFFTFFENYKEYCDSIFI